MRIAVLGAGGLGSKIGGLLALAGAAEVALICRNEVHARAVRTYGLVVKQGDEDRRAKLDATTDPADIGEVDLVLVTVKSYDTLSAARGAGPLLGPDSLALTLQNGLGNLEALTAELGADRCILGVTFHGATLVEPGVVADMGSGPTYFAAGPTTRERVQRFAGAFSEASMPAELRDEEEVDGLLWGKLSMVAGINPLAAVLRVPNGILGEVGEAAGLSLDAIRETVSVAEAKGIRMAFDPRERFRSTTQATYDMRSGTLLDALRGRRTEIDAISGAIADEGDRLGIPTPVNRMLWRIVKAVEATHPYQVRLDE